MAVKAKAPAKVCLVLFNAFPQVLMESTQNGNRSFLFYVRERAPFEVIKALLNVARDRKITGNAKHSERSASGGMLEGTTPIHVAAEYGVNAAVMSKLIEAYPGSVALKDKHDKLPLHWSILPFVKRVRMRWSHILFTALTAKWRKGCWRG